MHSSSHPARRGKRTEPPANRSVWAHPSALVGVGLVDGDIDGLLPQALDQTAADRRVLDQKRGGTIASLNLHHLLFERPKRKAAAHHGDCRGHRTHSDVVWTLMGGEHRAAHRGQYQLATPHIDPLTPAAPTPY